MGLAENCGAEAVLAQLRLAGVSQVFGIPGSTETPFLERIRAAGSPNYVLGLHEGAIVSMADGYARATGGPSVAMLHTTAGSLNAMAQIYNARRNCSPVVVLAGHKDRTVLSEDGFCAIPDLASVLRNVTKWAGQTLGVDQLAGDVARAMHIATTPPCGPVYLAMPVDLLEEEVAGAIVDRWPRRGQLGRALVPPPADLVLALSLIESAERPLLVLGSRIAGVPGIVAAFADVVGIPIAAIDPSDLTSFPYPSADPRYLGTYAEQSGWISTCDLVVAIGCRTFLPYSAEIRGRLPLGARLLHIDSEPLELGWDAREEYSLLADPAATLIALTEAAGKPDGLSRDRVAKRLAWRDMLCAARAERRLAAATAILADSSQAGGANGTLSVERLALELDKILPDDVVVFDEALRSSRPILQTINWGSGASIERNRGGALGWSVPAAIGWKLAEPDRPVLVVVGDGSFQFSVQALWSAARQGVSLVVLVVDNGGYLAVKRHIEEMLGIEENLGGKPDPRWHPGVEIEGLDHATVARGFGVHATVVNSASEAAAALAAGFAAEEVHVVVARVARTWP